MQRTFQLILFPTRFNTYADAIKYGKVIETDSLDALSNLFESMHTTGFYEVQEVAHLILTQVQKEHTLGTLYRHTDGFVYFVSYDFINSLIQENEHPVKHGYDYLPTMVDEFLKGNFGSETRKEYGNKLEHEFHKLEVVETEEEQED